jgi:hypothetical protein
MSNYQIPFDKDGNQLSYPDWRHNEWRDNYEFSTTLKIIDIERGRSAARFILEDEEGHTYQMFMKDMMNLLQGQKLEGNWTFCKRGSNYGITPALEKNG